MKLARRDSGTLHSSRRGRVPAGYSACENDGMSKPIPAWEPLSREVLADQLGAYDRMRAACALAQSPRGVTLGVSAPE